MTGWSLSLSDGIALAAFALSLLSLELTRRFNKRQNAFAETADKLNAVLLERENEQRAKRDMADVSASFTSGGRNKSLKIYNMGNATARNIRVNILEGSDLFASNDLSRKLPIPSLEKHHSVSFVVFGGLNASAYARLEILWDDDMGEGRRRELTVSPSG